MNELSESENKKSKKFSLVDKIKRKQELNFPPCLSILLLQTSKTDNNALDTDALYNLKLRKA
jgi:hypothetical protein